MNYSAGQVSKSCTIPFKFFSTFWVIQTVRSLKMGGGSLKNEQKQTDGGGILACVYVRFFKKNAEILKMKLYSYSPVFAIDYNGSMKY